MKTINASAGIGPDFEPRGEAGFALTSVSLPCYRGTVTEPRGVRHETAASRRDPAGGVPDVLGGPPVDRYAPLPLHLARRQGAPAPPARRDVDLRLLARLHGRADALQRARPRAHQRARRRRAG